tara:strand:- start:495 stop:686 length:192 start_codon:yes stop_codon:yes gene_type:complete
MDKALNGPPISSVVVDDIIGNPESYDIVFNEGIYCILFFLVFRATLINFVKLQRKNEENDIAH